MLNLLGSIFGTIAKTQCNTTFIALRSPAARTVLLHHFVPAVNVKTLCGVAHTWLYLHVCLREPCKVQ